MIEGVSVAEWSGGYIALEGIEGAGKSTVARRLADELRRRGVDVVSVREPGGTGAGERIREILLDPETELGWWGEALLFAASRAQLAAEVVGPALARGAWVVTDRSVYSSLAYQGGGRGLGVREVRAANEPGLQGVWPDLVIVLDIEPAAGLARQRIADRIGSEGVAFQARVAETFRALASAEPDRVVVVDASRSIDTVATDVIEAVTRHWSMLDAG